MKLPAWDNSVHDAYLASEGGTLLHHADATEGLSNDQQACEAPT